MNKAIFIGSGKILAKSLILAIFASVIALGFASSALAATPFLSANYLNSGSGSVQLTVSNANSFGQINLFTRQSSSLWTEIRNIGQTDQSGYFTQVVNLPSDGTSSQVQLYVTVGGLQSSTVSVSPYGGSSGCTYNCGSPYDISLSQNNLSLTQGQSATVSIINASGFNNNYYISSNSNSSIASASVSGNSLYINGVSSGSTTISVCRSNASASCVSLYVVVSGGGNCNYYGCNNISLSQTNVSLNYGQTTTVNAYNYGSGSLYISSNSNSSVVSPTISGSAINLYAMGSGSATVVVCANNASQCATIYVTVSGSGTNGSVWFSPSNPSLNVGQSLAVSINSSVSLQTYPYYSNSYYISSNSNPNIVSANVAGTTLNLNGLQSGSSSIVVCYSSISNCGTVYVTVSGYNNGGSLTLSQANLNMTAGQNSVVTIYGGGSYYISSNTNSPAASASISGSTVNVHANQSGSTVIGICQNNSGSCASLYVLVSGYNYSGGGLQYPGGNGNVLGSSAYPNGQLISENGTVYIVYRNVKSAFASASAFTGLGFKFSNVLNVGYSNLNNSGYIISSQYSSHPWGAWIKSGQTIYFVHESGLIPVPNWDIFLNNGGQASWIVPANSADFSLPILTTMTAGDTRLR